MEPRLPAGHLNQPKSGFGLPVHRWLRRHPQVLREAVRRLMDRGVLQRAVGPEFRRAWYLLVLDRWFTAFGCMSRRSRREFCSCRFRDITAWANTRARWRSRRPRAGAGRGAAIHFILSREAPYAADAPFPNDLAGLVAHVSFHGRHRVDGELAARHRDLRQRGAHGAAARGAAARRARRLSSARAGARGARRFACAGCACSTNTGLRTRTSSRARLGFFERLKLKIAGPARRALSGCDLLACGCGAARRDSGAHRLRRGNIRAGRSGRRHRSPRRAAMRRVNSCAAARALAARGVTTVYVGPPTPATRARTEIGTAQDPNWHRLGPLPQATLAELMRSARLIVANGGSTLLQAIACGSACVAVPIAKDQAERIRRCVAAGVAVAAALDCGRASCKRQSGCCRTSRQRAALAGTRRPPGARRRRRSRDAGAAPIWSRRRPARVSARLKFAATYAERRVIGLRSRTAVVPASHAQSHRHPRSGRLAGAAGAISRAAATGCAPGSAVRCWRAADVVVLHQIKLSALEARLFAALQPAPGLRRRRCHLCAQAAAARRCG